MAHPNGFYGNPYMYNQQPQASPQSPLHSIPNPHVVPVVPVVPVVAQNSAPLASAPVTVPVGGYGHDNHATFARAAMPVPAAAAPSFSINIPVHRSSHGMAVPAAVTAPQTPSNHWNVSLILVALAEEYLNAAYGHNSREKQSSSTRIPAHYCKLVAAALACLEAALKEGRLPPQSEASARYTYAQILFRDTTDLMEAEEALSKGVSLCERYRLDSWKYTMQHLLARIIYATNSRAALKYLETIIRDAEAEQSTSWIYALRFLHVSLSLGLHSGQDMLNAITQLRVIATLAVRCSHAAVLAIASTLETLIHVAYSGPAQDLEQAQRALAAARSTQLDPSIQALPQIPALLQMIDMACSLLQDDVSDATVKMRNLQALLDHPLSTKFWDSNGKVMLPLPGTKYQPHQDAGAASGPIARDDDAQTCLQMMWLASSELQTLGYLLSAAVALHRNAQDGKAERYLQETLASIYAAEDDNRDASVTSQAWRWHLRACARIQGVLATCARSAWADAQKELHSLSKLIRKHGSEMPASVSLFHKYLEGVVCQSTGELSRALELFTTPPLSYTSSRDDDEPLRRDLICLAALNSILIIHRPDHPQRALLPDLLNHVERIAAQTSSRNVQAAYHLARAVAYDADSEPGSLLRTKEHLSTLLQMSKRTANNQLMGMGLTFMAEKFFRGVRGEQSQKGARSALSLARRGRNDLWTSVANGLLADSLDTEGLTADAQPPRLEAVQLAANLPPAMQRFTT